MLDTWFSSALWPFATLGWPQQTPELQAFYPTAVNSTARDILFLWVARMVMMGIELTGEVPFGAVYVHSVIQAADGRRMSKSLGTGIDPLEQIDEHGADAVRFGLLAMSSTQDVRFSEEKIKQGRALAIKLFNAVRFVRKAGAGDAAPPAARPAALEDRWILSRLTRVQGEIAARIESFDFAHLALGLYDFVYGELCDWYVELVKPRMGADGELAAVLSQVLRETLALAHPVIPFVTEELWEQLGGEGLLAGAPYPTPDPSRIDEQAEQEIARVIEATTALRAWRDAAGVHPSVIVRARLAAPGYEQLAASVARLARFEFVALDGAGIARVPVPGGAAEVLPTEGVDADAVQARQAKRLADLAGEIARAQGKLANESFVAKAPAEVVAVERDKLERLREELARLQDPPAGL